MKIDVAYGRDLDDDMLEQLLYMEADAYACYDSIDSDDDRILIGIIPTETVKQFKRRTANILFLMKIKKIKGERKLLGMACMSKCKKDVKYLHTVFVKTISVNMCNPPSIFSNQLFYFTFLLPQSTTTLLSTMLMK